MQLYPYQKEAINALWQFWKESPQGAPLLVCPTGSGKSFVIASIIQQISAKYPKMRFLVATHTKEIVSQNAKELQTLITEPIGIYSAGLGQKYIRRITFANIQSIYKKAFELNADFLIIDEAHLISRNESSMYQTLISGLQKNNARLKVLGLTATPMRMDQGSLIAEGSTFTDIAYDISIRRLIEDGFLSPVISIAKESVDLSNVTTSGYDYNQSLLQDAFDQAALIDTHCKDIIKQAADRKHWLIFCAGIKHAEDVSAKLNEMGIPADYVTGEMTNIDRDHRIARFKDGTTKALCNVGVLTTGFNYRPVDCVVLLRATKSASLYIQCVGRGTRKAEGKHNCLVLDYGANIERHGPIDLITVKSNKGKKSEVGVAPHKFCPMCGCAVPTKTSTCPSCEYIFPESTKELELKPSTSPILSTIEQFDITHTMTKRHQKADRPDSFKIEYFSGPRVFSDFLCFDHGGWATVKAKQKWISRGGSLPCPATVDEAMARNFEIPPGVKISVIKRDKYHEILNVITESKAEREARREKEQKQYEAEALW